MTYASQPPLAAVASMGVCLLILVVGAYLMLLAVKP
jgi:hypothetical protein